MKLTAFRASLEATAPPSGLSAPLEALWWDANRAWDKAHARISHDPGRDAAWVHAYLHRKAGDLGNARYWYSRAGQPLSQASPADEWACIAAALLDRPSIETRPQ